MSHKSKKSIRSNGLIYPSVSGLKRQMVEHVPLLSRASKSISAAFSKKKSKKFQNNNAKKTDFLQGYNEGYTMFKNCILDNSFVHVPNNEYTSSRVWIINNKHYICEWVHNDDDAVDWRKKFMKNTNDRNYFKISVSDKDAMGEDNSNLDDRKVLSPRLTAGQIYLYKNAVYKKQKTLYDIKSMKAAGVEPGHELEIFTKFDKSGMIDESEYTQMSDKIFEFIDSEVEKARKEVEAREKK
jgi:hypothetical protein